MTGAINALQKFDKKLRRSQIAILNEGIKHTFRTLAYLSEIHDVLKYCITQNTYIPASVQFAYKQLKEHGDSFYDRIALYILTTDIDYPLNAEGALEILDDYMNENLHVSQVV